MISAARATPVGQRRDGARSRRRGGRQAACNAQLRIGGGIFKLPQKRGGRRKLPEPPPLLWTRSGAVMPTVPPAVPGHELVGELLLLGAQTSIKRPEGSDEARLVFGPELGELRSPFHPVKRIYRTTAVLAGIGDRLIEGVRVLVHGRGELLPLRLLGRSDFEFGLQKCDAAIDQLAGHQFSASRMMSLAGGITRRLPGLRKSGRQPDAYDTRNKRRRHQRPTKTLHVVLIAKGVTSPRLDLRSGCRGRTRESVDCGDLILAPSSRKPSVIRPAPPRGLLASQDFMKTDLNRKTRYLIAARALRAVAQGALIVDFTLYLHALSWSAVGIGSLFAVGMAFSIVLTLIMGPLSDRFGRKRFLLTYEAMQIAAAGLAVTTSAPLWLGLAAVVGTYGRGANGATGPFSPIEQAWLAAGLNSVGIAEAFRRNVMAGFFGMAAGSVAAKLPGEVRVWLPGTLAYRPIFALSGITAAICFALLSRIRDQPAPARLEPQQLEQRHDERRRLAGLAGVNLINGLGISLVGPFIAYWFHLRFGVGPRQIGPVMSAGFVLAGLSALASGRLIRILGLVDAVIVMRLLGLTFLFMLPFSPSFGFAAALHILRSTLNRGTAGARQALTVQLVAPDRRGLAATLGTVSTQIPRALGPLFGGYLFDADLLAVPFVVAGMSQAAYLALYRRLFRRLPFAGPG